MESGSSNVPFLLSEEKNTINVNPGDNRMPLTLTLPAPSILTRQANATCGMYNSCRIARTSCIRFRTSDRRHKHNAHRVDT